jgi:hypothetical protein
MRMWLDDGIGSSDVTCGSVDELLDLNGLLHSSYCHSVPSLKSFPKDDDPSRCIVVLRRGSVGSNVWFRMMRTWRLLCCRLEVKLTYAVALELTY